jgi:hypothetical protein
MKKSTSKIESEIKEGFRKANQVIAKKNLEKNCRYFFLLRFFSIGEIFSPSVPSELVLDSNVRKSFFSHHVLLFFQIRKIFSPVFQQEDPKTPTFSSKPLLFGIRLQVLNAMTIPKILSLRKKDSYLRQPKTIEKKMKSFQFYWAIDNLKIIQAKIFPKF